MTASPRQVAAAMVLTAAWMILIIVLTPTASGLPLAIKAWAVASASVWPLAFVTPVVDALRRRPEIFRLVIGLLSFNTVVFVPHAVGWQGYLPVWVAWLGGMGIGLLWGAGSELEEARRSAKLSSDL